ncbi:hypothetical protein JCM33374_g4615 [Metschnikowia sp. JCM 33374]|nr:hypothetical protein JCM33374_g4615 [Metschnikowia sp. JCM 33374]
MNGGIATSPTRTEDIECSSSSTMNGGVGSSPTQTSDEICSTVCNGEGNCNVTCEVETSKPTMTYNGDSDGILCSTVCDEETICTKSCECTRTDGLCYPQVAETSEFSGCLSQDDVTKIVTDVCGDYTLENSTQVTVDDTTTDLEPAVKTTITKTINRSSSSSVSPNVSTFEGSGSKKSTLLVFLVSVPIFAMLF